MLKANQLPPYAPDALNEAMAQLSLDELNAKKTHAEQKKQLLREPTLDAKFAQIYSKSRKIKNASNPFKDSEEKCMRHDLAKLRIMQELIDHVLNSNNATELEKRKTMLVCKRVGKIIHGLSRTLRGEAKEVELIPPSPFGWEVFEKFAKIIAVAQPDHTFSVNLVGSYIQHKDAVVKQVEDHINQIDLNTSVDFDLLKQDLQNLNQVIKHCIDCKENKQPISPAPTQTFHYIQNITKKYTALLSLLEIYLATSEVKLNAADPVNEQWMILRRLFCKIGEHATGKQNHALGHYHKNLQLQLTNLRDAFSHVEQFDECHKTMAIEQLVSPAQVIAEVLPEIKQQVERVIYRYLADGCPVQFSPAPVYDDVKKRKQYSREELTKLRACADLQFIEAEYPELKLFDKLANFLHNFHFKPVLKLIGDLSAKNGTCSNPQYLKSVLKKLGVIQKWPRVLRKRLADEKRDFETAIVTQRNLLAPKLQKLDDVITKNPVVLNALSAKKNITTVDFTKEQLAYLAQNINNLTRLCGGAKKLAQDKAFEYDVKTLSKIKKTQVELVGARHPEQRAFLHHYSTNADFRHKVDDCILNILNLTIGDGNKTGLGCKRFIKDNPVGKRYKEQEDSLRRLRALIAHGDAIKDDDIFLADFLFSEDTMNSYLVGKQRLYTGRAEAIIEFINNKLALIKGMHNIGKRIVGPRDGFIDISSPLLFQYDRKNDKRAANSNLSNTQLKRQKRLEKMRSHLMMPGYWL